MKRSLANMSMPRSRGRGYHGASVTAVRMGKAQAQLLGGGGHNSKFYMVPASCQALLQMLYVYLFI